MRAHRLLFLCMCMLIVWLQVDAAALDVRDVIEPESTPEALAPVAEFSPTLATSSDTPAWTSTPWPTVEASQTPSAPPTNQTFPTLAVTAALLPDMVLTPPALAAVGDGGLNWEYTPAWSPQPRDTGWAWQLLSSSTREVLLWSPWIDLRADIAPVALSFETQLSGVGSAVIEVSIDGGNWLMLAVVPVVPEWTAMTFDLSAFRGNLLQLRFLWQSGDTAASVDWWLDHIQVAEVPPTLSIVPVTLSTDEVGNPEQTPDQVMNDPITVTELPHVAALPCRLDADGDGVITEVDFSRIADQVFDRGNINIEAFDLNGNRQIDIGDLQMMAQYRSTLCPN